MNIRQINEVLDKRAHHVSMNNEDGKDIRLKEIIALKGIFKDYEARTADKCV